MFNLNPVRASFMLLFAGIALVLAFTPSAIAILALLDLQNWLIFAVAYVVSAILAIIFTGLVYVARDA